MRIFADDVGTQADRSAAPGARPALGVPHQQFSDAAPAMPCIDHQAADLGARVAFEQSGNEDMQPADDLATGSLHDQRAVVGPAPDSLDPAPDLRGC